MGPSAHSKKFKNLYPHVVSTKKHHITFFISQKFKKSSKNTKKDMFSQTVCHDPGPHVGTVSAWYVTGGMGQHGQSLMSRLDIEHKSAIT